MTTSALKRIDATCFMSEPFEAQDELKLRPPYQNFQTRPSWGSVMKVRAAW